MTLSPWRFNIKCLAHVLQSRRQGETIAFRLVPRNCGNWRYNIYLLTLVLWHFWAIHPRLNQKRMKAWPQKEKKNPFHHRNLDYSSCYVLPSIIIDCKFSWNGKSSFLVSYRKAEHNHSSCNTREMVTSLLHWQSKSVRFDLKVNL